MTTYLRTGTCNLCGQCCGCETAPNRDSPWAKDYLWALRTWADSDLPGIASVLKPPANGGPVSGSFQIGTAQYQFIWVAEPLHGLCKDLPPYGKTNNYARQCPLLMTSPDGGQTYPCAAYQSATVIPTLGITVGQWWDSVCGVMPPMTLEDWQVQMWEANHPACSYTYVEQT